MLINCSVCLADINLLDKEVSITKCGHFFHSHCLNDWLAQQMNCPECRAIITRDNFIRNIFPKVNEETASKLKSLEDRCESLKSENVLLKMTNSALKESKLIVRSDVEHLTPRLYFFYQK